MLTIGLTGGIGSGKSEVARMFELHGVPLIDADVIAHSLVQPGTEALTEIVNRFGDEILTAEGALDRKQLADIVFNTPELRQQLEAILHPRVREQISAFKNRNIDKPYIIVVIPLLLESGQQDLVDRILVVNTEESVRIQRVQARDNRNAEQIRAIIQNQADDNARNAAADDRLDNNGSLEQLQDNVNKLHHRYLALAAQDNFM
ncbi:MAG: dephospho-CoA kinase [Thiotrichales bacterium]|nr:MAG: dephospho-CoA kinase [Thiotrichales bacterium]